MRAAQGLVEKPGNRFSLTQLRRSARAPRWWAVATVATAGAASNNRGRLRCGSTTRGREPADRRRRRAHDTARAAIGWQPGHNPRPTDGTGRRTALDAANA